MENIQMVDLTTQYTRLKEPIDNAIARVLQSGVFIKGREVELFEQELSRFHGGCHTISVGNGTDALQIALMALDLEQGDEIIIPAFTYVATAEVIALLKLKPVLVDVDPDTMNIDPEAVSAAITPKTKAIIPVHLFGQCANMREIMKIARQYGLYVIEDNAQSIGAEYTSDDNQIYKSGTISTIGTTSFFPSKNLGAYGDGGALFTNDDALAEKIRKISNHGQSEKYYHEIVGVNSRLDSLQAAILRVKLEHLNNFISRRQYVAEQYDRYFSQTSLLKKPFRNPDSTHVFHQYTLQLNGIDREKLRAELVKTGIPAMVYYPLPLNHQQAYRSGDVFPVTEQLCNTVLSIPIHTEMTDSTLGFIAENVLNLAEKCKK